MPCFLCADATLNNYSLQEPQSDVPVDCGNSEQTRVLLTSAAYVHLKQAEFSKYTRNLSPASRAILLSGPAGATYQQMLAKALAHYFEAKLLLLDVTDFSLKIQNKYGSASKESFPKANKCCHSIIVPLPLRSWSMKRSISTTTLERVSSLLGSLSLIPQMEESKALSKSSVGGTLRRQSSGMDIASRGRDCSCNPPKIRRNASASANMNNMASQFAPYPAPLKRTSSWSFDEKLLIQSLYKVLVSVSKTSPLVLYIRDVEKLLSRSQRIYNLFQKMLNKLSGSILILGSQIIDPDDDYGDVDQRLTALFPYNIEIRPPEDENHFVSWKTQLEEDMKMIQLQDNKNHIIEVLAANDLDCRDLDSICLEDTMVLIMFGYETVWPMGWSLFQEGKSGSKDTSKLEAHAEPSKVSYICSCGHMEIWKAGGEEGAGVKPAAKAESTAPENKNEAGSLIVAVKEGDNPIPASKAPEVPPDNEFEKRIRPEVIPASEIGVTFADIGAMDEIKESLQELVMLPLRRPDLFEGGLLKPCRGILLFGPPGTGKTMLAKAIANEAGASFINVSMSTITSKWFGEDEKNVRALFTLAAKVSPTIIFVDEVDSMLGQRTRVGEHEAMRKIKNEFMTHWDGLLTKPGERILVLAATNRPFDLDEAIIRRFERRIMVGLPSVENREMIMKTLLSKEKVAEGLDFKELATMTEGYSGSDLKNLCTTAAYRPVRELIQQERLKDLEKKRRAEQRQSPDDDDVFEDTEERVITLRPLNMEDFRHAKNQVAASFAAEGSIMSELKQWNDSYGEEVRGRSSNYLTSYKEMAEQNHLILDKHCFLASYSMGDEES
ncbi:putative AAA domain-containing protein C24B10.10c [Vitis vinifera]|uniref:Putative AAA domain-containing protein C24B10.10c n=1 Tax=Vitis vinifera TaxID=29760 RepID=A0A438E638_VITVI|nr:putative AAA domain-containing protein C24B10.10c [Vitis vinifera]